MGNKLLLQLWFMSKIFLKGLMVQLFFVTLLLAENTSAQNIKDLKDIRLSVEFSKESIFSVIDKLEKLTDFTFAYNRADLKKAGIVTGNFHGQNLYDILLQVSKQAEVKFRKVNNSINVTLHKSNRKHEESIQIIQTRTVTGSVTSGEDGETIPGVNIFVKGTERGTVTDLDGNFTIEVIPEDILVFSAVGFTTEELTVGNRSVIDLQMAPDIQQLSEIVVVGYGEKSRKLMTESIGTVNSQQITKVPVASADAAIQGRISGVQITSADGSPGSPTAIRIRGVGTVGNSQPLFVIDGIPVGKNVDSRTNPLSTINPADIESISVLKDASAAAVYGVQAANGVVLITTKKGRTGKPSVNIDAYYGVQKLPPLYDLTNTDQWLGVTQDAYDAYNIRNELTPDDDSYLELHPDLQPGSAYRNISNQDRWINTAINENAPIYNVNGSITGGSEDVQYFVSAGVFQQESVMDKWNLERYTFRTNTDYKVTESLRIGQTLNVSYRELFRGWSSGGDGFLLSSAASMPPFFQIFDEGDSIPNNRYGYNGNADVAGLTIANQVAINKIRDYYDRDTRLIGSIYGELDLPLEGLMFRTVASIDLNQGRNDDWNPGYRLVEAGLDRPNQERGSSQSTGWSKVFTNTLNYENAFGDHHFNVLGGIEYRPFKSWNISTDSENFISADPSYYIVVPNGQVNQRINGGASRGAYMSYIGRLSYDFQQKYLVTFTVRRDGTWKFSPEDNRRWGTFPSVSGAWRVGEEDFMQNIPIINDLKIRASWGQLGNDETGFFPHIFRVGTYADYGSGETTISAAIPLNFVNRDVTWETVETFDVGIDASLFNNKVNLLATYYNRITKDFLINLPLPNITGFGGTAANFGEVLNTGIELELSYYTDISPDLSIDISGNLTTVNNELVSIREGVTEFASGNYRTAVGFPIGYFYGYQTDGLYQTEAEAADALPDANSQGPEAGDIRFVDTNSPAGDDAPEGVLFSGETDGEITPADRTYLGKTIPDFYYGLNIAANFKDFDLSVLFQGVGGVQLYNQFRSGRENLNGGGRNYFTTALDRWTGPNTSNSMPRAVTTDPNNNNRFSDRWIEDAGYFRLKNIQLGYTLPSTLSENVGLFNSFRIYIAATNILTLTPYSGPDPEVYSFGQVANQLRAGTDQATVPQTRTLQAGVQITF